MEILAKSPWSPVFVQFMGGWWKAKGLPANLTCPDGAMGKPPKRDFDDLSGGGAVFPFFFWVNRFMVGAGSSYRWDHNPFTSRVVTPFIGVTYNHIHSWIIGGPPCMFHKWHVWYSSINRNPFKIHFLTNTRPGNKHMDVSKNSGFPPKSSIKK